MTRFKQFVDHYLHRKVVQNFTICATTRISSSNRMDPFESTSNVTMKFIGESMNSLSDITENKSLRNWFELDLTCFRRKKWASGCVNRTNDFSWNELEQHIIFMRVCFHRCTYSKPLWVTELHFSRSFKRSVKLT